MQQESKVKVMDGDDREDGYKAQVRGASRRERVGWEEACVLLS